MFEEKNPRKINNVCWYRSYNQTFMPCCSISVSFNAMPLILLEKSYFEIASQWKLTNSCGLMLMCASARVNVLVQSKFCSAIYLLSQYLLVQSHPWKYQMNVLICWKLTINIPERCHWRRSGDFTVNFKHISHLALVFLEIFCWI